MADAPFLGMRGASDFLASEVVTNWRQGILRIVPKGMVPLTALTGLMPAESVDNETYHWHTKTLPTQRATVTGVYTDAILSTSYSTGGAVGQQLFIKMSLADSNQFRPGHQVLLRDASDPYVDVNAKVTGVVKNGASSYIAVILLEADDNSTAGNLSACDVALIIGNINADGGTRPESIVYQPAEFSNRCQIFRNSLDLTRRAMLTKLRTEDAYQEAKQDALLLHSLEMEKAFLFGITSSTIGANGKLETTTHGLIPTIKTYASSNVFDFKTATDTAYAGKTWLQAGKKYLNEKLEVLFRDGDAESRLVFCGNGALLAIQELIEVYGQWTLTDTMTKFGFSVTDWKTPFGTISLKTHPLFSFEETSRYSMVAFVPANLRFRYLSDTEFYPDGGYQRGGNSGKDGKEEEWLTDGGLEFHHPSMCGIFHNIGQDNTQ